MDVKQLRGLGINQLEHHLCRIANAAREYYFYHETGELLNGGEVNNVVVVKMSSELFSALLDLSLTANAKGGSGDNSQNKSNS